MASGIARFRRKQERRERDQVAARYEQPGYPLGDLLQVAQMADSGAQLAEADFPGHGRVLLVRYRKPYDDHPSQIEYQAVEPGQWLAYSPEYGFLYDTDDADWRQFYDRVGVGD
jgi:hypothetical protein